MLGGKTEKVAQPQLPQTSQPPERRDSSESGSKPVPLDGFASFHFVEGNPFAKQTPSTPPRRHPCRVCGIPSIRRCIHCKSAYYCSREHCIQACFRSLWETRTPDSVTPKFCRIGGRTNRTGLPSLSRSRSPSRTRPLPDAAERAKGLRPGDTYHQSQRTSSASMQMSHALSKSPVR